MDMSHLTEQIWLLRLKSISFWLPNPYLSASEAHRVSQIKTVQAWTYMADKLHETYTIVQTKYG